MQINHNYKINIWHTAGFYAIVFYLFITYIPQIIIHNLFYNDMKILYHGVHYPSLFVFFTFIVFIMLIVILDKIIPKIYLHYKIIKIQTVGSFISMVLITIYLLTAIYFYKHFGLDFRQTKSLSDGGIIIKVLWFVRMYGEFYIFYVFVSVINGNKLTFFTKIKIGMVLTAWILSLTGSIQFLLILIGFLFLFFPYERLKIIFIKENSNNISGLKIVFIFIFSIVVAIIVVFLGFANKIGTDKAINMFSDTSMFHMLISHIALRMSTSYTSVLYMVGDHLYDLSLQLDTYAASVDTFLNRLSSIIPVFHYPLDDFRSVNRTNYLLLFIPNFHPRAGASPGLLASIYYLPTFPFNFLFIGTFVLIIIRAINRYIVKNAKQLTFISKLIVVYFIVPMFESPLNMLSIIEPTFFYFVLFVFMSYFPPLPCHLKTLPNYKRH